MVCNIDQEDEKEVGRVGRKREYFICGLHLISRTFVFGLVSLCCLWHRREAYHVSGLTTKKSEKVEKSGALKGKKGKVKKGERRTRVQSDRSSLGSALHSPALLIKTVHLKRRFA